MTLPSSIDPVGMVHVRRLPLRLSHLTVLRTIPGALGSALVAAVALTALVGPFFAPHAPDLPMGLPGQHPTSTNLLGTDFIGRDVLSRTLYGGRSVLYLSMSATLLTYLVGVTIGMLAGFTRSLLDPLLMRIVDLLLSFPALVFLLVLLAGAGNSRGVLVVGVALVLFPGVARLVRTATLEASVTGYVEAAVANGEHIPAVLRREILPNIIQYITTDFGLRFSAAIILVASVNFLGLGLQPPTADWGLMIAENRVIISTNVWAVLAPGILLGVLTIGVNLLADGYSRTLGRSDVVA